MREILFRGKTERGSWVYGSLIIAGTYCCILESEEDVHPYDYPYLDSDFGTFDGHATPVIPETVGQWTGLTDKNGVKIFEGDIIRDIAGRITQVEYYKDHYYPFTAFPEFMCWDEKECEVIGNIHDNPPLMEVK